jgi:hypothetical protein
MTKKSSLRSFQTLEHGWTNSAAKGLYVRGCRNLLGHVSGTTLNKNYGMKVCYFKIA